MGSLTLPGRETEMFEVLTFLSKLQYVLGVLSTILSWFF